MVIIVDGLDCSGKSTVYNKLYDTVNKAYFIKDSYPGPSDQERIDRFNSFCRRVKEPYLYIYDRATVIDDPVYEYRFNQRDSILDGLLDESMFENVLVFHFTVEKEEWIRRMKARGDKYIDLDEYDDILNTYNRYYERYKPRVEVIDTTDINPDQAYDIVLDKINKFKEEMNHGF